MRDSQFWRQVLNTINEGLFMVDPQGRICEVNKALCELTGYSANELLGESCSIFQCDICAQMREGAVADWCYLFANKDIVRRRCRIRHKNGMMIPVLKNARLLLREDRPIGHGVDEEEIFSVETVLDIRELEEKDAHIQRVEKLLQPSRGFENMVGTSEAMQRVFRVIEQAAQSNAPVLILGESGTGKELAAQALHRLSSRRHFPFVELNCASLNEYVLESELFGHVKGAFTGALKDREGRFAAAHNGSLFLDEIGDIPLPMQVKILRVLETGIIHPVGSNNGQSVNVRIISATNKNLPSLIAKGDFREDLAFRINVIPIILPPLRERKEDIPLLVSHFTKTMSEFGKDAPVSVSPQLMRIFRMYPWPGNIRELRNILEYGRAMRGAGTLELEHMPEHFQGQFLDSFSPSVQAPPQSLDRLFSVDSAASLDEKAAMQKTEILEALSATNGNVSAAAKRLGVHRTTVINRMLRLGIRLQKQVF